MKILVVDDSSAIRMMLVKYLAEGGFTEVDQAADGEEAIALSYKTPYRLILLDWNMPKKSGLTVLQLLRARGNKVPVIMVTTERQKHNVLEAIRIGVNDYIFKPFTKELVLEKVNKLLGKT